MAIYNVTGQPSGPIRYTKEVDILADASGLSNSIYFYNRADGLAYYKSPAGIIIPLFEEISVVTNNKVLYVSPTGSDTDLTRAGHLGKITNAFLTLEAARDAAVSGDVIHVFPGTYTVTTTTTNGLAKDGITYYFEAGCVVNKATSGDIFNVDTFTTSFDIYGYADFNKTTATGCIFKCTTNVPFSFTIEARDVTSSISHAVHYEGQYTYCSYFNLRNVTSSAGSAFRFYIHGKCIVNANVIKSTSTYAIVADYGYYSLTINASKIESTTNSGSHFYVYSGASYVTLNVGEITGLTYGVEALGADIAINAYVKGITMQSGIVNLNGTCNNLNVLAGTFKGGVCHAMSVSGGHVETTEGGLLSAKNFTGGVTILNLTNNTYTPTFSCMGGKLYIIGASTSFYTYGGRTIDGGTVICDAIIEIGANDYVDNRHLFSLSSGTLILNGGIYKNVNIHKLASIVNYSGGSLIVNGATLLTAHADIPSIVSTVAGQRLRVYSGGMTTNRVENGGTLATKTQRDKLTISLAADTSIGLNDGSGVTETFSALVATYPTKAALAQQMVTLINASATLTVTASQDIPGTGEYFYLISDVSGVPYVQSTPVNVSNTVLRLNSYAMTEITGGMIIEDSDVI